MSFDLSGWLDDDAWRISGVASEKHPDGGTYAIPCPSIRDTALLRRITGRFQQIGDAEDAVNTAVNAAKPDADTVAEASKRLGDLNEASEADLLEYLGVDDFEKLPPDVGIQELMQRKLLGPVYDEMVADGLTSGRLERVYQATVIRFTQNEEVVRLMVEFEGKAAALDNRATRRAAKKAPAKAAPRSSSPKAGSKSSPASSATPARTPARASTRSSKTSATTATTKTA